MPGEIVHHENRNKQDASPDNLNVLPSQAAHASIHSKKNKTCDICERKHSAKGLCKYHYNKRWFAAHPGYIQSRNHSKKGGDAQ